MKNIEKLYSGLLLFSRRKYEDVLIQVEHLHFEDYSYGLNKYNLQVKSIYEIFGHSGRGQIIKQISNYKDYVNDKVKRQYISPKLKARIFNFLNILAKILDYPYKKYSKEIILDRLYACKEKVIDKKWLEEKIKQLK